MTSPRIPPVRDDDASAPVAKTFQSIQRAVGRVPNLHRTLAHSPAALDGYLTLAQALSRGTLSPALREQLAVATAGANGCAYCASAHVALGKGVGVAEDELVRNLDGDSSDAKTAAALAFARRLIESRGGVADAELQAVRAAGYDDVAIVEIVAHVAMNTFTNVFNRLARTEIDFPEISLEAAR